MRAVDLWLSPFFLSLVCYFAICSVDLVSLCLFSQQSCSAAWFLFDLSGGSCLGQVSLLVCLSCRLLLCPWWNCSGEVQSNILSCSWGCSSSLSVNRTSLLNPSAVGTGKAVTHVLDCEWKARAGMDLRSITPFYCWCSGCCHGDMEGGNRTERLRLALHDCCCLTKAGLASSAESSPRLEGQLLWHESAGGWATEGVSVILQFVGTNRGFFSLLQWRKNWPLVLLFPHIIIADDSAGAKRTKVDQGTAQGDHGRDTAVGRGGGDRDTLGRAVSVSQAAWLLEGGQNPDQCWHGRAGRLNCLLLP